MLQLTLPGVQFFFEYFSKSASVGVSRRQSASNSKSPIVYILTFMWCDIAFLCLCRYCNHSACSNYENDILACLWPAFGRGGADFIDLLCEGGCDRTPLHWRGRGPGLKLPPPDPTKHFSNVKLVKSVLEPPPGHYLFDIYYYIIIL